MIRDVIDSSDISRTSVHKILQQNLEMKKVCLKLVLIIVIIARNISLNDERPSFVH